MWAHWKPELSPRFQVELASPCLLWLFSLFWSVTECDAGLRQFRGFWVMSFSLLWRFCVFHVFCASVHRALLWWASGPIMSSCVPGIKFLNGLLLAQWAFINIQPLCVKVLSQLEVIKLKWWMLHAIIQSKCSLGSYSCVSTSFLFFFVLFPNEK